MFRPSSPDRLGPDRRADAIAEARALLASHAPQKAATLLEDALAEAGPTDRAAIVELLRQSYRDLIAQSEAAGKSRETALYRDNLAILDQAKVAGPSASPIPGPGPRPGTSQAIADFPARRDRAGGSRSDRSQEIAKIAAGAGSRARRRAARTAGAWSRTLAGPRRPRPAAGAARGAGSLDPWPTKEPQTLAPSPIRWRGAMRRDSHESRTSSHRPRLRPRPRQRPWTTT